MKRICIYCGSKSGNIPIYGEKASEIGKLLAISGKTLVYGGGNIGMMKVVADSVLDNGGEVIGVIPRRLKQLELAHTGLTECYVTESMHERKLLMNKLSDAFIALPGGWGTLEEISEAVTWTQLNYQNKPTGLLNTNNYYDLLIGWLNHAEREGFMGETHRNLLVIEKDPTILLEKMNRMEFTGIEDHI